MDEGIYTSQIGHQMPIFFIEYLSLLFISLYDFTTYHAASILPPIYIRYLLTTTTRLHYSPATSLHRYTYILSQILTAGLSLTTSLSLSAPRLLIFLI